MGLVVLSVSWSGPDCYLYFCVVWMFQAGMKRDFLSSPSFGSGIVRKGIYLMGVFLHSSEHWLVVMASVMTEILWSTQISISTLLWHQITRQAEVFSSEQATHHLLLRLNLPQKLCCFSKSGTKRCKWKFIVFQLYFFDPVMSRGLQCAAQLTPAPS